MRIVTVLALTVCQFTVFPFLAVVAANTIDDSHQSREIVVAAQNITTVYKTAM